MIFRNIYFSQTGIQATPKGAGGPALPPLAQTGAPFSQGHALRTPIWTLDMEGQQGDPEALRALHPRQRSCWQSHRRQEPTRSETAAGRASRSAPISRFPEGYMVLSPVDRAGISRRVTGRRTRQFASLLSHSRMRNRTVVRVCQPIDMLKVYQTNRPGGVLFPDFGTHFPAIHPPPGSRWMSTGRKTFGESKPGRRLRSVSCLRERSEAISASRNAVTSPR